MICSKALARKFANHILRDNRNGRSYRVIAREDYPVLGADGKPIVKPGTLNRIAKSKGKWLPEDQEILMVLGLIRPRSPFSRLPKWYKRTPEALKFYDEKRQQAKDLSCKTRDEAKRWKQKDDRTS